MSVVVIRGGLIALALSVSGVYVQACEIKKVQISKLTFAPAETIVHVCDTVEWSNADFIPHTATVKPVAGSAGWDVLIPAGKTGQLVVSEVGTVDYICRLHPNMRAKIIVLAK
jgi:plastocyanin